jgi:hypothetical protein
MEKLEQQVASIVKEHGLAAVVHSIIENFDGQADFANLSGDKKSETTFRRIAVILFDALRKIDSV